MSEALTRVEVRARAKIIDADVHPWINGDIKGLKKYLSRDWWAHFDGRYVLPNHWLRPPLARASSNRIDAMTPSGGEPGSDPVFMKEQHLDKHNISHAILSSIQAGKLAAIPTANEAVALATAFNEYFLNEFITVDDRYKLAMVVAAHDPQAAATEIRRIGHLPNVVAVYMPLLNILMGQKHYYPIYEAAESLRLPILIHPTGTEGGFPTAVAFAGGTPSTYIERHTNFPEIGMSSINSMIFEGVFYRFPGLKLLAAEKAESIAKRGLSFAELSNPETKYLERLLAGEIQWAMQRMFGQYDAIADLALPSELIPQPKAGAGTFIAPSEPQRGSCPLR